jgi:alkylated DNA repair dioxygenase AlkB
MPTPSEDVPSATDWSAARALGRDSSQPVMDQHFTEAHLDPPEGLVLREDTISHEEEQELLERFDDLRWDPIVIRGQTARRTAHHYGLAYDYESRAPRAGESIPAWLAPARRAAAALAGIKPDEWMQALVQRYPPGAAIGWHRDSPAFGIVAGISVRGTARLRLRRGEVRNWEIWETELLPRSGYVLSAAARWSWQHSIPPAKELRYSITFRTLQA